ncbi:hypothetical protein EAH75_01265 [Rhodanobacter glycinis]|uniref:hypothetical protein n=1 Tax=Rhodanobacter glycinis TaxID=582702 RepID=UPI00112E80E5|nr:hypothetical protein [Rhodanobacter glycinis]TPG50155.1 hypothetical protein EAH75_01265 [Rhodanobacter glycinis]
MSQKIVCEIGLTETEFKAVLSLIGCTAGRNSEPNDALSDVFDALHKFGEKSEIPRKYLDIEAGFYKGAIQVNGWSIDAPR